MSLSLRWVGEGDRDRVAETRMLSYAPARNHLPQFVDVLKTDVRSGPGDWLLAERDGVAVGTATSYPMTMWVRGGAVRCQGVGYVGTIKTQRRRAAGERGVGTAVMNEVLRAARERGFVVSALMPFRGSFYEHFGYGFVERRAEWTMPMNVLPSGEFDGFTFARAEDLDDIVAFKQRITQRGQGDIERTKAEWQKDLAYAEKGFVVIDRAGGSIHSSIFFETSHKESLDTARVIECLYEDLPALKRVLNFLASLRDQYSTATLTLQADVRLNGLLSETQMTHRPHRNHPTAECRPFNRMQIRVLDHAKLIEGMKLPVGVNGKTTVAIREREGGVSTIAIEMSDGHASVKASSATTDVECEDRVWSPLVMGDLTATQAAAMGLVRVHNSSAIAILDNFAVGPAPFCNEYF